MAQETGIATINPTAFAASRSIVEEHWQALIKQQNWTRTYRPKVYLALHCGSDATIGWYTGASDELATHNIVFPATSGSFTLVLDVPIVTADHVTSLKVGARVDSVATFTGDVRFTYFIPPGTSATADISYAFSDNGTEKRSLLDISGIKNSGSDTEGRLQVYIKQTSTTVDATLRNVRVLDDYTAIGTPIPSW